MPYVCNRFLEGEANGRLGGLIAEEPAIAIETKAWHVTAAMPGLDDQPRKENAWDPGRRVSMILASLTREGALAEARFDHLMNPLGAATELFEFKVRLDAVLDLSTPQKLAKFGLELPTVARFYDVHDGVRRLEIEDVVMRERLVRVGGASRKVTRVDEEITRVEKVTAIASCVGFEGMLVPSFFHTGLNLIVFYHCHLIEHYEIIAWDTLTDIIRHGAVNWSAMPEPDWIGSR